jgi:3-oxoacyl-[acyl-carrier-protein] synthase-1
MKQVYITGSSLICALGNDKFQSIQTAKKIDTTNYKDFFQDNHDGFNFFKINQTFKNEKEKFYTLLEDAVSQAIEDANLSQEEQKELHIFIGSTSMSISINEEQSQLYYNNQSTKMLEEVGYGNIGTFVEKLVDSKYKATILQTACTSTANSIAYATEFIQANKIKRALVIGLELFNKSTYKGFESLMLLSKNGIYKPFDKESDGLILGETCSVVIVDSVQKDNSCFKIIATNTSFDNYSITGSNPSGETTCNSMQKALKKANLTPKDLTCIKAHATGSENSNLSEAKALDTLFKAYNETADIVILKPFLGHTLGACGTSEIVLLCEFIKEGFIPKTLNYQNGYDDISFEPLLENKSVSNTTILFQFIGFGGSNTTLILSNKG